MNQASPKIEFETSQSHSWWRLRLVGNGNSDELAGTVMSLGAAGTEIISEHEFYAFLNTSRADVEEFCSELSKFGIELKECSQFENKNWVAMCEEVWKPVVVGALELVPVLSSDSSLESSADKKPIYIIPGSGFGTGHHETTRNALWLLQSDLIKKHQISKALDVGTGNGVLALACAELYQTDVDALDNDSDALVNARESQTLNSAGSKVRFFHSELNSSFGKYDLIMANIYSAVLRSLESRFYDHLNPGGLLILSGVTKHFSSEIFERFAPQRWKLLEQRVEGDWWGCLSKRV